MLRAGVPVRPPRPLGTISSRHSRHNRPTASVYSRGMGVKVLQMAHATTLEAHDVATTGSVHIMSDQRAPSEELLGGMVVRRRRGPL